MALKRSDLGKEYKDLVLDRFKGLLQISAAVDVMTLINLNIKSLDS